MRGRPFRSHIYLPVVRLGVNDTDWPWILLPAIAAYAITYLAGIEVRRVSLAIPAGVAVLAGGIAFFNWTRRGRRPEWLRHSFVAAFRPRLARRRLPTDRGTRPWVDRQVT